MVNCDEFVKHIKEQAIEINRQYFTGITKNSKGRIFEAGVDIEEGSRLLELSLINHWAIAFNHNVEAFIKAICEVSDWDMSKINCVLEGIAQELVGQEGANVVFYYKQT